MLEPMEEAKLVEVTPETAREWLKMNTFPGQRGIRHKIVRLLKGKIESGDFRTGEVAFAVLKYDNGREVLMNGQHQLTAVNYAGRTIMAKVERYLCNTPLEASHLFRQFDNTQRSLGDMVKVESVAMNLGWPLKIASLVVSAGITIDRRGDCHSTDKAALLQEYFEEGTFVNDMLYAQLQEGAQKNSAKHMMRSPVVAAMVRTYQKDSATAYRFWQRVRDGVGLSIDNPEYKLREFLKDAIYTDGRVSMHSGAGNVVTSHEIYARCITAWNAARKNKSTNLKYHANNPVPEPV